MKNRFMKRRLVRRGLWKMVNLLAVFAMVMQTLAISSFMAPAPVFASTTTNQTDPAASPLTNPDPGVQPASLGPTGGSDKGTIVVIKHVVGGPASASDWTMHVGKAAQFPGSEQGRSTNVDPGTYQISETGGPIGYDATFSGDCDTKGELTVAADETKTCTVTNTFNLTPAANPRLSQTCGLDIGMVVDISGSIDSGEMSQMKSALSNFASAFVGTPTVFSLTEFNTDSFVARNFSRTPTQAANDVMSLIPPAGDEYTNWESGLARGLSTFDPRPAKSNLIVIATDGSPNRWGYPLTTPAFDYNDGFSHAVQRANTIKAGGTRIVVVGIGDDTSDPASPTMKLEKLKSISGTNVATTTGAITPTTDVIKVSDFSGIGTALSSYASSLCGGKILVQKQFDTNGNGTAELNGVTFSGLLSGYTFAVSGGPSSPAPQTTDDSGALEFSVLNGTYSVQETNLPAGVRAISAACVNGTKSVGTFDPATQAVTGLVMSSDDTISCTFINGYAPASLTVTKNVVGGTAQPSDFGFRIVGSGGAYRYPENGKNSVTFNNLNAGTYSVEEKGPDGYYQSSSTCSRIVVAGGAAATCSITNTFVPPVINLTKSGPESAAAGSLVTYTINWSVAGELPVTEAVVTDVVPAHVSYVSQTCGTTSGTCVPGFGAGTASWALGARAPGDHGTLTLQVRIDSPLANGTQIKNTASFDTCETAPVDASATTKVISGPTLSLKKVVSSVSFTPGDTLTYTLNWSVGGTDSATGTVLVDTLPPHSTFVSASSGGVHANGVVTWNLGTRVPGNTGTVSLTVKTVAPIANGSLLVNQSTLDSNENDPVTASAISSVVSAPGLAIVKSNNVASFMNPGRQVVYTVVVTNNATATDSARSIQLTDTLPNGFTFADTGLATRTTNLGNLAPGESKTVTFTVNVSEFQPAGTYVNTATAKGANTPSISATSQVEVRAPLVLGALSEPALAVMKQVTPKVARRGGVVSYSVTVKNVGDADATTVVISDTLPSGFRFLDTGTQTRTFNLGTIEPSHIRTITYDVQVGNKVKSGNYRNSAIVTADGLDPIEARAILTVKVPKVLGLAETGPSWQDYLTLISGILLAGLGTSVLATRRRRHAV